MPDAREVCLALLIACAPALASCRPDDAERPGHFAEARWLDVQMERVLQIGSAQEAPPEYLFGRPEWVVTDGAGYVYVADAMAFEIRVFSADGTHLRTIGARGEGPGEFQAFTGFTIDRNDDLIVADWRNARYTRYATRDREMSTIDFGPGLLTYPRTIRRLSDDEFLVAQKPLPSEPDYDYVLHVFTSDFQEKRAAFGEDVLLGHGDDEMLGRIVGADMRSVLASEDEVIFVPFLYDGRLFVFRNEGGEWRHAETVEGFTQEGVAFEKVTEPPFGRGYVSMSTSVGGPPLPPTQQRVGYVFRNQSVGLWRQRDGSLVHFTLQQSGRDQVFGVEIFDEAGILQGYGEIDRIEGVPPRYVGYHMKLLSWKDDADVYYFVSYADDMTPTVEAYELHYALTNRPLAR